MSPPPRETDPLIGSVLGDAYRLDRLIAAGGMGAVYEAQQLRLRRRVAVKVLLEWARRQPESMARFYLESEIVTHLDHPHIVQIFDLGRTQHHVPYLVMEYLEGETLSQRLHHDRVLPVPVALNVVSQLCAALAHVHSRGFVHCDVKPSNVFLVRAEGLSEFVKLLDFGVSVARGRTQRSGEVVGTPCYMAPEQAQGLQDLDHRVDQFAVAALGYQMLTGRKAFCDQEHVASSDTDLPAGAGIPEELDRVLTRALSRAPERRYPDIAHFARALAHAGSQLPPAPPSTLEPSATAYHYESLPEERLVVPSQRPSSPPTRVDRPARPATR